MSNEKKKSLIGAFVAAIGIAAGGLLVASETDQSADTENPKADTWAQSPLVEETPMVRHYSKEGQWHTGEPTDRPPSVEEGLAHLEEAIAILEANGSMPSEELWKLRGAYGNMSSQYEQHSAKLWEVDAAGNLNQIFEP